VLVRWAKILGVAGVIAVLGAAGAVAYQRRHQRTWVELTPDELRSRLHARLEGANGADRATR
jgi:hypothetical protein